MIKTLELVNLPNIIDFGETSFLTLKIKLVLILTPSKVVKNIGGFFSVNFSVTGTFQLINPLLFINFCETSYLT